jgi:hypothetical protein
MSRGRGVAWEGSLFKSGERERSELLPQASRVAVEGCASKPKRFVVLPFISDRPPSFLAFPSKSSLQVKVQLTRQRVRGLEENSRESLPSISDRPPSYAAFPSKSILVETRRERNRAESFSSSWSVKRSGDMRDDSGRSESRFVTVCAPPGRRTV